MSGGTDTEPSGVENIEGKTRPSPGVPTMVDPSALVRMYPLLELIAWRSGVAVVDRPTIWPRTGRTGIGVCSASAHAEAQAPFAATVSAERIVSLPRATPIT